MRFGMLGAAALWLLLGCFAARPAAAEHRAALLIANRAYDDPALAVEGDSLPAVRAVLEQFGFRCTVRENLAGEELRKGVDSFASATPVRGTALVYFAGRVLPANYKGKDGVFLAGTEARAGDERAIGYSGYRVDDLLQALAARGGSSANLVLLEVAGEEPELPSPLPEETLLATLGDRRAWSASRDDDLLPRLRSAAAQFESRLPAEFALRGRGSESLGPPETVPRGKRGGDEWVNGRGTVFCWCPAGEYTAGSGTEEPARYPDEEPREVRIEQGFWISKYELTLHENLRGHPGGTLAEHKNHPLTMMHLDDARHMIHNMLNEAERKAGRLPAEWEYALASEEQWEYAARAGTTTRYYFGDDPALLPRHANFGDRSYYETADIYSNAAHRTLDDGAPRLAIVGSYAPNPWGLHDMAGNVLEWCRDNAARGGSWVSPPEYCRSAYRNSYSSRNQENFLGFRVVLQRSGE